MTRFLSDFKDGNSAQSVVMALFAKCGLHNTVVDPKSQDRQYWDIITDGHDLSFTTEVKFDKYEARSGNIAIETFNPRLGKPSGLGITKAFFWAHVLVDNVVWITPTNTLRLYVKETPAKKVIKIGGDGNAELQLYSSEILPVVFTRIDKITSRKLLKYIKECLHG